MNIIEDIAYRGTESASQKLDIYTPDSEDFDTVVWFHGGGLESGSRKGDKALIQSLVNKGIAVVSADYRMYPAACFPDFVEDAAYAVKYTVDNIMRLGGNGNVFVAGSSAGAYLCMMLCLDKRFLKSIGTDTTRVRGFISDSAQQLTHFNILKYERSLDTRLSRIDESAPIYFIKPDMKIKPLMLIYYTDDIPCRPEENRLMYAALKNLMPEAKVELIECAGTHVSGTARTDSDGEYPTVKNIIKFIKRVYGR